ncbi:MAG: universal stress protein [Deltaproteobacteria bacterium]|nr:universal stress protein [Deltaproteobacteria bacterium]
MKKILVGYRGIPGGNQNILKVAKQHALAFNASLNIVSSAVAVTEGTAVEVEDIKKHLAEVKKSLEDEGITCETELLVRGLTPGEDLVEYANDNKMDEIIIGIEKKSKVGKLLFGSDAQYVILEAKCPVVCAK